MASDVNANRRRDFIGYLTGHAADNVGTTYGRTELATALKYLNQIDLGVTIPKWKPA